MEDKIRPFKPQFFALFMGVKVRGEMRWFELNYLLLPASSLEVLRMLRILVSKIIIMKPRCSPNSETSRRIESNFDC